MATKVQKMVGYAKSIAKDDSHGYSQVRRWPSQGNDFDCSSLMYQSAKQAGYDVPTGVGKYTGTMLADFRAAGFTALRFDGNLSDLDPGDIMLNVERHTEMYVGDGKFAGAHCSETGGIEGKPGDQTGNEISIVNAYIPNYGWDYVLVPPKEAEPQAAAPKQAGGAKKTLDGIDIASWQGDLVPGNMSTTDFIVVKATGGKSYTNPYFKKHADATLKAGKLLGLYHFAADSGHAGTAQEEADHFVAAARPYIGKAALFLDWEADALARGPSWAKAWLDRVREKTCVTPGIYMSKSTCREHSWSAVAKTYPLWVAQYPGYEPTGYQKNPWTDSHGYGAWSKPIIFQYTSEGRVKGYGNRLDLDLFYGTAADFKALMAVKKAADAKPAQAAKLAVDGSFGPLTKKELQRQLGVKVTGKFDKATKKALQKRIGVAADGVWGPKSKAAYRRKLGLAETASAKAACKALQKALNAGKVAKW